MVMSLSAGFTLFNYVFFLFVFNTVLYGVIIVIFNFLVFCFLLVYFCKAPRGLFKVFRRYNMRLIIIIIIISMVGTLSQLSQLQYATCNVLIAAHAFSVTASEVMYNCSVENDLPQNRDVFLLLPGNISDLDMSENGLTAIKPDSFTTIGKFISISELMFYVLICSCVIICRVIPRSAQTGLSLA